MNTLITFFKEHIAYKNQILKLAKSDLIKTYRGSALGWTWAIIKPAVTILVYFVTFTIGLRAGATVNGFPYFLWLISGVIPWFYIGDMISLGTDCIRKYSYLVTKIKYPISTIPTFVSISKFYVHLLLIAIMILIFWGFGFAPSIYYLQLPFYMLCMFVFFCFWALFASMLSCISKDFANLVKSFVTAIFWLSGILFNPETVQSGIFKKFLMVNPITFLINGFRNCFINQIWFWQQPKRLLYFAIILLIMIILAVWAYKKLRKEIPDVL